MHHYLCSCGWGWWTRRGPRLVRRVGLRCPSCGRRRSSAHRCAGCEGRAQAVAASGQLHLSGMEAALWTEKLRREGEET